MPCHREALPAAGPKQTRARSLLNLLGFIIQHIDTHALDFSALIKNKEGAARNHESLSIFPVRIDRAEFNRGGQPAPWRLRAVEQLCRLLIAGHEIDSISQMNMLLRKIGGPLLYSFLAMKDDVSQLVLVRLHFVKRILTI